MRNVARQVRVSPGHQDETEPLTVDEARRLASRLGQFHVAPPKTPRSRRVIPLLPSMLAVLREHQDRQAAERLAAGVRWIDTGLVFTTATGTPFEPNDFSKAFAQLCKVAGVRWIDTGLVFPTATGTPFEPNDFSKAFAQLCKVAGVRRVRLHDRRHTCASMLLAHGVPPRVVMEILGHSAIEVTMRIYGHVMLDAQRQALTGMDELLTDD